MSRSGNSDKKKDTSGFVRLSSRLEPSVQGLMEKGYFVFGDPESVFDTYGRSDSISPLLSPVDFKKFYLISIHMGLCPTGGYSIRVLQVSRAHGSIRVVVEFREPSPNDIVTMVMTTPHAFIMIPRERKDGESPTFSFVSPEGCILAEKKPLYFSLAPKLKERHFKRNQGGDKD